MVDHALADDALFQVGEHIEDGVCLDTEELECEEEVVVLEYALVVEVQCDVVFGVHEEGVVDTLLGGGWVREGVSKGKTLKNNALLIAFVAKINTKGAKDSIVPPGLTFGQ